MTQKNRGDGKGPKGEKKKGGLETSDVFSLFQSSME